MLCKHSVSFNTFLFGQKPLEHHRRVKNNHLRLSRILRTVATTSHPFKAFAFLFLHRPSSTNAASRRFSSTVFFLRVCLFVTVTICPEYIIKHLVSSDTIKPDAPRVYIPRAHGRARARAFLVVVLAP